MQDPFQQSPGRRAGDSGSASGADGGLKDWQKNTWFGPAPSNSNPFEEPEDAKEGDDFNVVVVYESTPVLYDEKGDPYPYDKADWNQILDVEEEGGNS